MTQEAQPSHGAGTSSSTPPPPHLLLHTSSSTPPPPRLLLHARRSAGLQEDARGGKGAGARLVLCELGALRVLVACLVDSRLEQHARGRDEVVLGVLVRVGGGVDRVERVARVCLVGEHHAGEVRPCILRTSARVVRRHWVGRRGVERVALSTVGKRAAAAPRPRTLSTPNRRRCRRRRGPLAACRP